MEDRFELRAPELTTDEFLQLAARESQLSRDHQALLSEFLQQADVVKFSGRPATADQATHSSRLALRFLEETRENAPDVEVEEAETTDWARQPQESTTARGSGNAFEFPADQAEQVRSGSRGGDL